MLCWATAALGSIIVSLADVEPPGTERGELALWTGGITEQGGSARVWFTVPSAGRVTLALFDVHGRHVATLLDHDEAAGRHALRWDGRDGGGGHASAGLYLLRIGAGGRSASGKLIVIH